MAEAAGAADDTSFVFGLHRGNASTWDDQAAARLCEVVVSSNNGMAAQVATGRTDLLDVLPLETLQQPVDDLGSTLIYLAVFYDRPEMVEYLHKRGVDIEKACDPMEFGNPMFYAIHLRRVRLMLTLDLLGCTVRAPCDSLRTLPQTHVQRLDDVNLTRMLDYCFGKEQRAGTLVTKHYRRIKTRKRYLRKLAAIPLLLRVMRGMIGRARVRKIRKNRADLVRRAERRVRREEKISNDVPLNSDDESSVEG